MGRARVTRVGRITGAGAASGLPRVCGDQAPRHTAWVMPPSVSGGPPGNPVGTRQQWRPMPPPQQAPGARLPARPGWQGSGLGSARFTPVWLGSQHAPQDAWPSGVQDGPVGLSDVFSSDGGRGRWRPYAHGSQR